jgi:hypothetical protein
MPHNANLPNLMAMENIHHIRTEGVGNWHAKSEGLELDGVQIDQDYCPLPCESLYEMHIHRPARGNTVHEQNRVSLLQIYAHNKHIALQKCDHAIMYKWIVRLPPCRIQYRRLRMYDDWNPLARKRKQLLTNSNTPAAR